MADIDPYEGFDDEAAAMEKAARDFFGLGASLPPQAVRSAIQTGSIVPITSSSKWKISGAALVAAFTKNETALVHAGLVGGAGEIPKRVPVPRFSARIGELAEKFGGERATAIAEDITTKTRDGIKKMIGRASREYGQSPSMATLRRLEGEVRAVVGMTPKQAARVERWRAAAVKAGLSSDAIEKGYSERAASAIAFRAKAIADRGIVETIAFGRHQSWVEAIKTGELPKNVKKRWNDQGDKGVRRDHRRQTLVGPIPIGDLYEIQGVMHPPSPDQGCRCWETLVMPPKGQEEYQTASDPEPELQQETPPGTAAPPAPPPQVSREQAVADIKERFREIRGESETALADLQAKVEEGDRRRLLLRERMSEPLEAKNRALFDGTPFDDPLVQLLNQEIRAVAAEMDEEYGKKVALLLERNSIRARMTEEAHAALRVPAAQRPDPLPVQWKGRPRTAKKAEMKKGLDWLDSVLQREGRPGATLLVESTGRGRSFQSGESIMMAARADAGTAVHEVGHWLERDPAILDRSIAFLQRRTEGEPLRRLAGILPGHGYRDDELTRRDKFTDPYTGKAYETRGVVYATEILSMGLEAMFRDPLRFAEDDPDFFDFVLRFLRGLP